MTTRTKDPAAAAPTPSPTLETRKFTVAEYYRMGEAGILKPDERVELIEGEIIVMPPIGPGHSGTVNTAIRVFSEHAPGKYLIHVQNPIHLGERSEPQAGRCAAAPRDDDYFYSHPTPSDVLLVIEVADSSLEYDRQTKAHVYGRAGIPETWVRTCPRTA